MISKFTLMNMSSKNSLTFGQTPEEECLFKDDGIDWGKAPASHSTFSYPTQLGEYIASTSVKGRDISIEGYVYYIPTDLEKSQVLPEELEAYCYERIKKKKELLNGIVNPEQTVRLTIGSYFIEGKPEQSIVYGSDDATNNIFFCKFLISLFCSNPMFRKTVLPSTVLSGTKPAFRFPLIIPQGVGIKMGIRSSYRLIAIENEGNVSTGCVIRLKAKGTIVNPTITNIQTGEFITIDKTLVNDEEVEINTNDGNEKGVKGYIDGKEFNYFKYWNFESTWLKFPIGTSLIGFSLKEGDETLLDINITVNPLKYALEDM